MACIKLFIKSGLALLCVLTIFGFAQCTRITLFENMNKQGNYNYLISQTNLMKQPI